MHVPRSTFFCGAVILRHPAVGSAGDVCKYPRYPYALLAKVEDTFGPRSGRDGFVCDNVRKLLAYREGAMLGVLDTEAVEADIVDADSE
jgi:hypothetical protein